MLGLLQTHTKQSAALFIIGHRLLRLITMQTRAHLSVPELTASVVVGHGLKCAKIEIHCVECHAMICNMQMALIDIYNVLPINLQTKTHGSYVLHVVLLQSVLDKNIEED